MGFIFDLLLELLMPGPWRRKSAVFDCNLREIEGSQEGPGDGWHYGDVSVHPGRLEFEVGYELRDGLLKGFGKPAPPISVTVDTVAPERQRNPNDSEKWKVSVDRVFVELTTDTATLEWAVPTKRLKFALERLQSSEISG